MSTPATAPAGWYDENGRQRWWDGAKWSDIYAPPATATIAVTGRVVSRTAARVFMLLALVFGFLAGFTTAVLSR